MLRWLTPSDWQESVPTDRRAAAGPAAPPQFLTRPDVASVLQIVETSSAAPSPAAVARRGITPPITIEATVPDDAEYLLVVRYASGAFRLVAPQAAVPQALTRRRTAKKAARRRAIERTLLFQAPGGWTSGAEARRSIFAGFTDAIGAILVRVSEVINEVAVGPAERTIWRIVGRKRGLHLVSKAGLTSGVLPLLETPPQPGPNGRALLFLHGTFSATAPAFAGLAGSDAFDRLASVYGEAIYGFDHFSVSVEPKDNAKALLDLLSSSTTTFDVVTHSRGGLVLRNLVERAQQLGPNADRFRLGKAILVACPNEGTPLATPSRIGTAAQWIANLIDATPAGALVDAKTIALWLSWFARIAVMSAPGLDAMNADSLLLADLQQGPPPDGHPYSALVANYVPDDRLWARILDLGADVFFQSANDLVVPTPGGWRVDKLDDAIPGRQVGCFGPGGNIDDRGTPVSHIGFFERKETADFITHTLRDEPLSLPPMQLDQMLPSRRQRRSLAPESAVYAPAVEPQRDEQAKPSLRVCAESTRQELQKPTLPSLSEMPNVLELMVIQSAEVELLRTGIKRQETFESIEDELASVPLLLATYRGARVSVPFRVRKQDVQRQSARAATDYERATITQPEMRWGELIAMHRVIKRYVDGIAGATLPDKLALERFGDTLFETLLPGAVRRLFDLARASGDDRLVVVFTSMINWVSDIPWEFARDPNRETFLATEDVHFLRNVLTPIPIERISPSHTPLRMLITTAEPAGFELPAAKREAARIQQDLASQVKDNRMSIDLLDHATPASLHHRLVTGHHDIVHFIGHGSWNQGVSGLVLEDENGGRFDLDERNLREMFAGRKLRVVFLNACDTGRGTGSGSQPYSIGGTAQSLFGRGIQVVVANQLKVRDRAAADFASQFYRYLAHGLSIVEATREARIAASYAERRESIDWAIPVVYARNAGGPLVQA
jgi:hypothetical protein